MTEQQRNLASRLWRKDASLWRSACGDDADDAADDDSIANPLGWLSCVEWMQSRAAGLQAWAREIADSGCYDRAILLGMGGSSLAPAVCASLFEAAPGYLPLTVLDTTNPDEIAGIAGADAGGDLRRCLFMVASKSGSTVETADLYQFFHAQVAAQCADPHSRFVVITDQGSRLHQLAQTARHRVFLNPRDIGGRYSALSYFGMAPAALLGVDVGEFLARADAYSATTKSDDPAENSALALGMFLGRCACAGRDKLILELPPRLGVFGLWIEQLIAESTGKDGKGLVPVIAGDDRPEARDYRGEDRINVRYVAGGHVTDKVTDNAGENVDYTLRFDDPYQLGAEYFRWEIATAVAAAYLRVNPFNQPDVARSKDRTRRFIRDNERLPAPAYRGDDYDLHWHATTAVTPQANRRAKDLIADFRRTAQSGCYLGILAYLPEDARTLALLKSLGAHATRRWGIVATLGMGPRYLHSTGQLHKGGPATGRFLQFTAEWDADQPVPQRDYTFGRLYQAQADGDFSALADGDGVVMRVRLKADRLRALAAFVDEFSSVV